MIGKRWREKVCVNTEENTRESERMSRTFMTIIERERNYENFMKIIKKF